MVEVARPHHEHTARKAPHAACPLGAEAKENQPPRTLFPESLPTVWGGLPHCLAAIPGLSAQGPSSVPRRALGPNRAGWENRVQERGLGLPHPQRRTYLVQGLGTAAPHPDQCDLQDCHGLPGTRG